MDVQNILQLGGLALAGVGVMAILRRFGLLGPPRSDDPPDSGALERATHEGRRREDRARRNREAADEAAREVINSRPVSDDPAADLADRLYGRDGDGAS